MSFQNKSKGKPVTFWKNNLPSNLTRELSIEHTHKDGTTGHDLYYKDVTGKVQAKIDGLTISEAQYLKKIRGF